MSAPPSFSASSASIRSRWFCASQRAPASPPVSSPAVSATIKSRPSFCWLRAASSAIAANAEAIALSSLTPRA